MKAKKKLLSIMLCMLVIGTCIPLTSAMKNNKINETDPISYGFAVGILFGTVKNVTRDGEFINFDIEKSFFIGILSFCPVIMPLGPWENVSIYQQPFSGIFTDRFYFKFIINFGIEPPGGFIPKWIIKG